MTTPRKSKFMKLLSRNARLMKQAKERDQEGKRRLDDGKNVVKYPHQK